MGLFHSCLSLAGNYLVALRMEFLSTLRAFAAAVAEPYISTACLAIHFRNILLIPSHVCFSIKASDSSGVAISLSFKYSSHLLIARSIFLFICSLSGDDEKIFVFRAYSSFYALILKCSA